MEKGFTIKKFLGWTSGFRAKDDLPRAQSDETEFRFVPSSNVTYPLREEELVALLVFLYVVVLHFLLFILVPDHGYRL